MSSTNTVLNSKKEKRQQAIDINRMGIISLKEEAAFPVASAALGITDLKFHLEMQSFLQMGLWPLSSRLTEVLHK